MKKAIHFLCPAMAQMLLVCITAAVLHAVTGVDVTGYSSPAGILVIAAGGLSTAIWGTVYQIRHNGKTIKSILSDFFRFRADIKGYLLAAVFLLLDFIPVIAGGHMAVAWYRPFMIFPTAILFGGVEEIGWRYTFQPLLEEKLPYVLSSLITFMCWGIWHFMFFYIDGSLSAVRPLPFLTGLLINCFILSCIFNYRRNLWLCAMTHALINTGAQSIANDDTNIVLDIAAKIVIIILAAVIDKKSKAPAEKLSHGRQ